MKDFNQIHIVTLAQAIAELGSENIDRGRVVVSYQHDSNPPPSFPNPIVFSDVQCIEVDEEVIHVGTDGAEIEVNRVLDFYIVKPSDFQLQNRRKMKFKHSSVSN